ncbi:MULTISPECIES: MlaD family protein [Brucella]|uniref:ABC transporter substrate-binding protein n=2 Tax=Brucella suis TaxID=29461 RepID=A0AAI8E5N0_BRUSS|nr:MULTISPECIES: MlaD family protein [Brucella]AAN29943.1 ABC transporter, periplasmic substrate-binding protein, putative [Brucella suis 1330]AEM18361.1 ABC transporter, periplasmic substrate-binding protein, putative [Brucella suis 1330]AEU06029.1 ABC transporter, periplasmic substrate-binding protein, putative [Brucella suis VBI22]AHN46652.1 ABC transporter periplasmic substrate-binding protein [Brucella suis bv. 1 str. S2]AIN84260.1 ABC transporter substrate-binding protein [Brucella suis]
METKANYVLVGVFTLLVSLLAFGFVYWIARYGEARDSLPLDVRIQGSVTGLGIGSQVLFNGIKVGDVRRLHLDDSNPGMVIVQTRVNATTPITRSTTATLGFQGLTGQAYIELKGGRLDEPNLLTEAAKEDTVARIDADPSAVNNLLATAQDIAARANNVLSQLEGFVKGARGPLTDTINNTKTFTQALADNADIIQELGQNAGNIRQIVVDAKDMMARLNAASVKVESILNKTDKMLSADDKNGLVAQAITTLQSIRETSNNLDARLAPIANNLDRFSGQGLREMQGVVIDSRRAIQRIEQVITELERNPQRLIFGGPGSVPQYDGRKRH